MADFHPMNPPFIPALVCLAVHVAFFAIAFVMLSRPTRVTRATAGGRKH